MFKEARVDKKTWRAVLIGAAVPIAMLAGAPAVSAAETDQTETVNSEQLPLPDPGLPLPGGLPDPAALALLPDLLTCVTDLLAALPAEVPDAPVAGTEQLPLPLPVPDPGAGAPAPLPDIAALTTQCQDALATLTGAVPEPPVDAPVLPKD
jgi:hypothetical protein